MLTIDQLRRDAQVQLTSAFDLLMPFVNVRIRLVAGVDAFLAALGIRQYV